MLSEQIISGARAVAAGIWDALSCNLTVRIISSPQFFLSIIAMDAGARNGGCFTRIDKERIISEDAEIEISR